MLAWGPWDACWASSCARPVWATWVLAQNWIGADRPSQNLTFVRQPLRQCCTLNCGSFTLIRSPVLGGGSTIH
jgi:hypothetical protein